MCSSEKFSLSINLNLTTTKIPILQTVLHKIVVCLTKVNKLKKKENPM